MFGFGSKDKLTKAQIIHNQLEEIKRLRGERDQVQADKAGLGTELRALQTAVGDAVEDADNQRALQGFISDKMNRAMKEVNHALSLGRPLTDQEIDRLHNPSTNIVCSGIMISPEWSAGPWSAGPNLENQLGARQESPADFAHPDAHFPDDADYDDHDPHGDLHPEIVEPEMSEYRQELDDLRDGGHA